MIKSIKLIVLLLLPLFGVAQTKSKILIVPPQSVMLNGNTVRAMASRGIKPDSLVDVARKTFVTNAGTSLADYTVKVLGPADGADIKTVPVTRTTKIKVKRRNFITKKEKVHDKKIKYKGTTIGPDEKLKLEYVQKSFDFDYVVFITLFEVSETKSINFALKPLNRFAVHYEIYDKNMVFKTGNVLADDLTVSPSMAPSVLFHYLTLSAQNVYMAVSSGLN